MSIPVSASSDGMFATLAGGALASTVTVENAQGTTAEEPLGVSGDYVREVTINGALPNQLAYTTVGNAYENSDTGCGVNFGNAKIHVHFLQRAGDVESGRSSGTVCK